MQKKKFGNDVGWNWKDLGRILDGNLDTQMH